MLIPFDTIDKKYHLKSSCALHLGANTGQEAEAYDKVGIKRVVWVEASEVLYRGLVRHITPYPGHTALQVCVSDTDGQEVMFHVASNSGQSSSILEFGTHAQAHPEVKFIQDIPMVTCRVDTVLRQHGITFNLAQNPFLNIDLQGAELLALRGMGKVLGCFRYAYIEVNEKELYRGCPLTHEIDAYLAKFGFTPRETLMTGAFWGDRFYSRA